MHSVNRLLERTRRQNSPTVTDDLGRYHACATELCRQADVVAADVLETDIRTGTPTIEVVVEADRVPPAVLQTLADHDCGLRDVSRRGDPVHTIAVVV